MTKPSGYGNGGMESRSPYFLDTPLPSGSFSRCAPRSYQHSNPTISSSAVIRVGKFSFGTGPSVPCCIHWPGHTTVTAQGGADLLAHTDRTCDDKRVPITSLSRGNTCTHSMHRRYHVHITYSPSSQYKTTAHMMIIPPHTHTHTHTHTHVAACPPCLIWATDF